MTVGELKARLADLPDDGDVFVYVGPEGVTVQAEFLGDAYHATEAIVLTSRVAVPVAGGPCEVGTDPASDTPSDDDDVITCSGCGATTTDPDLWDPDAETGVITCNRCWAKKAYR